MPRNLKEGQKIRSYEIVKHLNTGMLAVSYAAKSTTGEKVFFKQYKSPTPTLSWYGEYVKYQAELKRRIQSGTAANFTYRFIDFFEEKAGPLTYFQVFEFMDKGKDLDQILETIRTRPKTFSWDQRMIFARVMMSGVDALHKAKIVHCDLKPTNIYLCEDSSIEAGYKLKVVDMDFSILADRRAPWDGEMGYVGSTYYFSPEHLKGEVPLPASDVFTCGLMLYELLAQGHPYRRDDAAYLEAVLAHDAPEPILQGTSSNSADVINILQHCLSADSSQRPTAEEVNQVLNARKSSRPYSKPLSKPAVKHECHPPSEPVKTKPIPSAPTPTKGSMLQLCGEVGSPLRFRVKTDVGRKLCQGFGPDSQYISSTQFTLEPGTDGRWVLSHCPTATNETLLNGKAVTSPVLLSQGDVIAVGHEAKGVSKLPITIRIT